MHRDLGPDVRVTLTPTCVACFGCVAVCPTAAIEIMPGRIALIQEACIRCKLCELGCAVDGIRVVGTARRGRRSGNPGSTTR